MISQKSKPKHNILEGGWFFGFISVNWQAFFSIYM